MAEPIDDGLPFEVGDLWRPSAFADEGVKTDSLFDIEDAKQSSLDLGFGHESAHFTFENQDLDLPAFASLDSISLEPLNAQLNKHTIVEKEAIDLPEDEASSIWDDDLSLKDDPKLCTWENFGGKKQLEPNISSFLSEAGPLAFDAALRSSGKNGEYEAMMPQDATLRALCHLSLGRSSVFFQWDDLRDHFLPILNRTSISGLTIPCSESFMTEVLEYGTVVMRLRRFAEETYSVNVCSSILALRSSISSIVSAASEAISAEMPYIRTLLQLQGLISRPHRLLDAVWSAAKSTFELKSNIEVISAISDFVYHVTQYEDCFNHVWSALLARVSKPWLETLATDLGLDESGKMADAGSSVLEIQESPTTLSSPSSRRRKRDGKLTFLQPEDKQLIEDTKASLSLIRENMPGHPLCMQATWGIQAPLDYFYGDSLNKQQMANEIRQYENRIVDAMLGKKTDNQQTMISAQVETLLEEPDVYSNGYGNAEAQENYLNKFIAQMSSLPNGDSRSNPDYLGEASLNALQSQENGIRQYTITNTAFTLLDQTMPLIKTQYRLANGAIVRHLFRQCQLRQHLELQHSFHLLQSGDFVDRLSTALFRSDVQSAERKRGKIPTGQVMGLRLGTAEGQRWPPASSELQLTLMGILNETYTSQTTNSSSSTPTDQLPGDLSFSIRELPDSDIDRVLDANSIHALDFLRLQYTPPPPLDTILTPDLLQKYDDIFRFLLILLRLNHVVKDLRIQTSLSHQQPRPSPSILAFVLEAQNFLTTLTTQVMDVGISSSWRNFSRTLQAIESALRAEDEAGEVMTHTTIGIPALRTLHEGYLERIRGALFLKKKQEKLRGGIYGILSSILRVAGRISASDEEEMVRDLEGEIRGFKEGMEGFLKELRGGVDRAFGSGNGGRGDVGAAAGNNVGGVGGGIATAGATEMEAARMLLLRLRWREDL